MQEEVSKIQKLINEKAERRLDRDLEKLREVRGLGLLTPFNQFDTNFPKLAFTYKASVNGEIKDKTLEYELPRHFEKRMPFMQALKDYWLPLYIDQDTADFLAKVEQLDRDVAALKRGDYDDQEL